MVSPRSKFSIKMNNKRSISHLSFLKSSKIAYAICILLDFSGCTSQPDRGYNNYLTTQSKINVLRSSSVEQDPTAAMYLAKSISCISTECQLKELYLARAHFIRGEQDRASDHLSQAILKGYDTTYVNNFEIASLLSLDTRRQLTDLYLRSINLSVRDSVAVMVKDDQLIRNRHLEAQRAGNNREVDSLSLKMELVDSLNRQKLRHITDTYGWPGAALIGESIGGKQAPTASLLVIHMDEEANKYYLDQALTAASEGKASYRDAEQIMSNLTMRFPIMPGVLKLSYVSSTEETELSIMQIDRVGKILSDNPKFRFTIYPTPYTLDSSYLPRLKAIIEKSVTANQIEISMEALEGISLAAEDEVEFIFKRTLIK